MLGEELWIDDTRRCRDGLASCLPTFGGAAEDALFYDRIASRGTQLSSEAFSYAGRESDPVGIGARTYGRTPAGELTSLQTDAATKALVGENRHGDVSWLMDASASVSDTRIYDPYGSLAGQTGTTDAQVGFQGDYTDPTSTQVWMGARWYDPAAAIFTARDDIWGMLATPVSLNRYTYAQADPMEFFDPDGRFGWSSITGFANWAWGGVSSFVSSYIVQPFWQTASGFGHLLSSTAATITRLAHRWSAQAVQRITSTTQRLSARLADGARRKLAAITMATASVQRGIASAAGAVAKCFDGLKATCTRIAADVVVGAAVGALCVSTAPVCAVAAGAAGGAASGALGCRDGESLLKCTLMGGAIGGATAGATYGIVKAFRGVSGEVLASSEARVGRLAEEGISAPKAVTRAESAADFARLTRQLQFEEASSVFTRSGGLQPSVINESIPIVRGAQIGNQQVIKALTSDGSNIAEWAKYTTQTFQSPSGSFQVRFYRNSVTDAVDYSYDYKSVFVGAR